MYRSVFTVGTENVVKSLSLEKPASNIIVSGDDSKLYTYNMEEDFEKVYVYDTGL